MIRVLGYNRFGGFIGSSFDGVRTDDTLMYLTALLLRYCLRS